MPEESNSAGSTATSDRPADSRRRFSLEIASLAAGALVGLAPLVTGLVAFLDPLRGRRKPPRFYRDQAAERAGFIRVAPLSALPVGGVPQRFPVIADQRDAWNFVPQQPIGAVYIERIGKQDLRVFNATCPHAGCSVSCNGSAYHCPCHNSSFNLDGTKMVSTSGRENPSPRDLDDLNVDEEKLAAGEIWVEFKNFYTGREEQIAKS